MPIASTIERLSARLRFRDLQLLVALEAGQSLRAAALQLNVTQPALSRTLHEIEVAFGVPLFARTSRGLVATAEGVAATRGARQLLEELVRVKQEVELGAQAGLVIRLGVPPFIAHSFFPALMTHLLRNQVPIYVELMESPVLELFDALAEAKLDAIISTYSAQPANDARVALTYDALFSSKYKVIAPATHHLCAGDARIALAKLAGEPWIMPTHTSMLRSSIERVFQGAGLMPPRPIVESNNPLTNIQLVGAGVGLAIVPERTLGRSVHGLVRELRTSPTFAASPVALIYRAGSTNSRLDILRKALEGC